MKHFVNLCLIAIICFNYNQCSIKKIDPNKQLIDNSIDSEEPLFDRRDELGQDTEISATLRPIKELGQHTGKSATLTPTKGIVFKQIFCIKEKGKEDSGCMRLVNNFTEDNFILIYKEIKRIYQECQRNINYHKPCTTTQQIITQCVIESMPKV